MVLSKCSPQLYFVGTYEKELGQIRIGVELKLNHFLLALQMAKIEKDVLHFDFNRFTMNFANL